MPVTMYDSDNPDAIPSGVHAAGYINGYAANAWLTRGYPRFPDAKRISVFLADDGDVCDVETGDLLPWEAPEWCQMAKARGVADPWVYVNLSNWNATKTEFELRGMAQPSYWVADYDNVQAIPAGAIAKQYADPAIIPGHPHYDLSVVTDAAFGGGGGIIVEEAEMKVVIGTNAPAGYVDPSGPNAIYITNGVVKRHVLTPAESAALLTLCGQTAPEPLDQGTLDRMPRIEPVPLDNPAAPPLSFGAGPPGPAGAPGPAGPPGTLAAHDHVIPTGTTEPYIP